MFKNSFIFIFFFIFMTCSFVILEIHKAGQISWQFFLIIVVGCFLTSWWFTVTFTKRMQVFRDRLLKEDDMDFDEQIVCKDGINHFEKVIATGGIGYLLQNKFVFIPHKLNFSKKELTIPFSDIIEISDYKIWHFFDTGTKITLQSGKVEKFVIDKTSDFYNRLINLKTDR